MAGSFAVTCIFFLLAGQSTMTAVGEQRSLNLIFDHTPLRDAVAEISRYSSTKITVASAEVADIPIGGIFRIGDTNSFIDAVAKTYNLRIVANKEGLILERASDRAKPQAVAQKNL
jgi:hypothetical protein